MLTSTKTQPLAPLFYTESPEVVTIRVGYFDKGVPFKAPIKSLINYIRTLPKSVTHIKIEDLVFYDDDLFVCSEAEIIEILSAIPPHVTHLQLNDPVGFRSSFERLIDLGKMLIEISTLGFHTLPSKRTAIFGAIPKTIQVLNLGSSAMDSEAFLQAYRCTFYMSGDLAASISALPRRLRVLGLANAIEFSEKELLSVMAALPPAIQSLNLSHCKGGKYFKPSAISIVVKKLPQNIVELNLSHCITVTQKLQTNIFADLPKNLRKLDLSNNDLFEALACPGLYGNNIDAIDLFASIPEYVDQIIINGDLDLYYIEKHFNWFERILPMLDEKIPNARERFKFHPKVQEYWQTLPLASSTAVSFKRTIERSQLMLSARQSLFSTVQAGFLLKCLAGAAMYAGLLLLIGFLASPIAATAVVAGALVVGSSCLMYRLFCQKGKEELAKSINEPTMVLN